MSAAEPAVLESAANVPAMSEAESSVAALPAPRRVAIATLFREILRTEQELAAMYAAAAQRTPIAYLRTAFAEFAEAKRRRVEALTGLAPLLVTEAGDGGVAPEPRGTPPALPERRSDIFARGFEAERALEVAYREVIALLGGAAPCPALQTLAGGSARHRALLRDLYLRYS
jgi:hypothetical protein